MRTNILTICDFAKEYNGQLNIIGTFNHIRSEVFPTNPISFYIVCQFVIKENIVGEHFVTISVVHKDSGEYLVAPNNFKLDIQVENVARLDRVFMTNLLLNLDKTVFKKPGTYVLTVESDKNTKDLEFYVEST